VAINALVVAGNTSVAAVARELLGSNASGQGEIVVNPYDEE
jgi:hypothetical protein